MHTPQSTLPTPVGQDSRTCFGILFFAAEDEAAAYSAHVRASGQAYNGGFFDGMACGRDRAFDREVDGQRQYAVTVA